MKIIWRCEQTEYGMLVEGACTVGDKKFGHIEVIPHPDFTAEKMQSTLNLISESVSDMTKEIT